MNSLPITQEEPAGFWSWVFPDHSDRREVIDYIKNAPLLGGELPSAGAGQLISTSMIDVMDRHILAAINSGGLTEVEMDEFQVKGKGFEAFLTFNGFTHSVVKRLATMERAKAVSVHCIWPFNGKYLIGYLRYWSVMVLIQRLPIPGESRQ